MTPLPLDTWRVARSEAVDLGKRLSAIRDLVEPDQAAEVAGAQIALMNLVTWISGLLGEVSGE